MMTTIDLKSIGYIDEPDVEWRESLDAVRLCFDLKKLAERFAPLFPDAYEQAINMDDDDFMQFRAGLVKERKGRFAGEDFMNKFGSIMLPANMLHVGQVSAKFGVPFGLAFCRMIEAGMLDISSGIAKIESRPADTESAGQS